MHLLKVIQRVRGKYLNFTRFCAGHFSLICSKKIKEFKRTSSLHLKWTPILNCTHKRVWLLKTQIKKKGVAKFGPPHNGSLHPNSVSSKWGRGSGWPSSWPLRVSSHCGGVQPQVGGFCCPPQSPLSLKSTCNPEYSWYLINSTALPHYLNKYPPMADFLLPRADC